MSTLLVELRSALVHLRRSPGFAAFAIGLLALGIAAATVILSVLQSLVLQDLPYPEPDRLVGLRSTHAGKGLNTPALSAADLRDVHRSATSFTGLAGCRPDFATWTSPGADPVPLVVGLVTEPFFAVFGVAPLAGRTFASEEFRSAAARTVVLSETCWRTRFGGRPDVLGTVITLNDRPTTIIGIMPARFREPQFVDAWLPFPADAPEYFVRDSRFWTTVGRLPAGGTAAGAQAELATIAANLALQYPATNHGWRFESVPLRDMRVDASTRQGLWLLTASVLLVLLVGSINLANLLLSRGLRRMPEFGVRLSLGATPRSLARSVLLESLLLALAGGLLGIALAGATLPVLAAQLPDTLIPRAHEIALRVPVLLAALGAALATGVLCGVLPAAQVAHADAAVLVKAAGTRAVSGRFATRMQRVLLAGQVAMTLAVLTGAALLGRSFTRLQQADPGFRARDVLALRLSPPLSRFRDFFAIGRHYERLHAALRSVPGVVSSSVDCSAPFCGVALTYPLTIEGRVSDPGQADEAVFHSVGSDYFDTLGLRLVTGRLPAPGLSEKDPAVVVINETLARRLFPGTDPVGRRLKTLPWLFGEWREIIGVVADARQSSLALPAPPALYVPQQQSPWFFSTLMIRTRPEGVSANSIQAALREVDPSLAIDLRSLVDNIALSAIESRLQATVFTAFGVVAVALSGFGIFASTSFAMGMRRREVGLRMALGASPARVCRWILEDAARPTLLGLAAGLPLALAGAGLLRGLLFGVGAFDPVALGLVVLLVVAVTLVAALAPALQAARLNPAQALQRD